ncbi:hypothetical protein HWV62_33683 [Athelia sp. TMB]|nr:hypothetical protein HWV62_33683 [Athelia sp. TMB]
MTLQHVHIIQLQPLQPMLNTVEDMFLDLPALVRIPICVKLDGAAIDLDLAVATHREEGLGKGDSLITGELALLDRLAGEDLR